MTASGLVERFARLESRLAEEKGDFALFALFLREDVGDRWDLIVSAPWVGPDKESAVSFLVGEIKSKLGDQDLTSLSRIVIVDPDDVAVQNLNRGIHVEHGQFEVRDTNFFGLAVRNAHIITSKRPAAPVTP